MVVVVTGRRRVPSPPVPSVRFRSREVKSAVRSKPKRNKTGFGSQECIRAHDLLNKYVLSVRTRRRGAAVGLGECRGRMSAPLDRRRAGYSGCRFENRSFGKLASAFYTRIFIEIL